MVRYDNIIKAIEHDMVKHCGKTCKCMECEHLMTGVQIVYVENKGLSEKRTVESGWFRCGRHGKYARKVEDLPFSQIYDDMIYIRKD